MAGGERRARVVSVRLTGTEHAAWRAAAQGSARATVAGWARVVLGEVIAATEPGQRPGAVVRAVEVPGRAVAEIAGACGALNEAVRRAHTSGRTTRATVAAATAVASVAGQWLACWEEGPARARQIRPARQRWAVDQGEVRPHLVNLRATEVEMETWAAQAAGDGYERVSAWARCLVGASIGGYVPAPPAVPSARAVAVRRHLGGAITNVAQLVEVTQGAPEAVQAQLVTDQEAIWQEFEQVRARTR